MCFKILTSQIEFVVKRYHLVISSLMAKMTISLNLLE